MSKKYLPNWALYALTACALGSVVVIVSHDVMTAFANPAPSPATQAEQEDQALKEAWGDWVTLKRGDLLVLESGRVQAVNYLEPTQIHLYDYFGAASVTGKDYTVVQTRSMQINRVVRVGEPEWGALMQKFVGQEPYYP